jgi:putative flippase GtrA
MYNKKNRIWHSFKDLVRIFSLKILRIDILDKKWNTIIQFIKFGLVGVSNTIISYCVYLLLIQFEMQYILASVIGFLASIVNAFYWSNKYVFPQNDGEKRPLIKSFIKLLLSYSGTGLVLQNLLLFLWVDMISVNKSIAPLLNLIITIPLNYILNKLWAFKTSSKK